jgi:hypothetical protein
MMDRSQIIDWGGVEYPHQKPAGYGEYYAVKVGK